MRDQAPVSLPWDIEEIPFDRIDLDAVRPREDLLFLVSASSFVEILSDLTTRNLVGFLKDDAEAGEWLSCHWEHEEIQHGRALRRYVQTVWPEFDWEAAYGRFYAEYSKLCTVDGFEPTPCLEMIARCVIEMGTATYYRSLSEFAPEPVLRDLAGRIRDDEVRHYKHFLQYFTRYRALEGVGRRRTLGVLMRRLNAVRSEDADIALWHSFATRHPTARRDGPEFREMFDSVTRIVRNHFPIRMAVKMLVRPLDLTPVLSGLVSLPVSAVARLWILR